MLSTERTKELLRNQHLSDLEAAEMRDFAYLLAEMVHEKWLLEQLATNEKNHDNTGHVQPRQ